MRICGKWARLYPAVDRLGKTIDFRLGARRDVTAAKAYRGGDQNSGARSRNDHAGRLAASQRAVREMKTDGSLYPDERNCDPRRT
ncbi:DDE-type integrase/transposase/recombinase [Paraburkholderia caribensis]|uniref:DDE-type integrase/transposase/recombinase n=1 Tax=Paraburkholderia caribensis TaxID=75105 RepID=UPI00398AF736